MYTICAFKWWYSDFIRLCFRVGKHICGRLFGEQKRGQYVMCTGLSGLAGYHTGTTEGATCSVARFVLWLVTMRIAYSIRIRRASNHSHITECVTPNSLIMYGRNVPRRISQLIQ